MYTVLFTVLCHVYCSVSALHNVYCSHFLPCSFSLQAMWDNLDVLQCDSDSFSMYGMEVGWYHIFCFSSAPWILFCFSYTALWPLISLFPLVGCCLSIYPPRVMTSYAEKITVVSSSGVISLVVSFIHPWGDCGMFWHVCSWRF